MFCCNDSKLDATSCNTRPVEVAKVSVKTEAKGFLAFLLIDPRGAETQQEQISNYKDNRRKNKTKQTQKPAPHPAQTSHLSTG